MPKLTIKLWLPVYIKHTGLLFQKWCTRTIMCGSNNQSIIDELNKLRELFDFSREHDIRDKFNLLQPGEIDSVEVWNGDKKLGEWWWCEGSKSFEKKSYYQPHCYIPDELINIIVMWWKKMSHIDLHHRQLGDVSNSKWYKSKALDNLYTRYVDVGGKSLTREDLNTDANIRIVCGFIHKWLNDKLECREIDKWLMKLKYESLTRPENYIGRKDSLDIVKDFDTICGMVCTSHISVLDLSNNDLSRYNLEHIDKLIDWLISHKHTIGVLDISGNYITQNVYKIRRDKESINHYLPKWCRIVEDKVMIGKNMFSINFQQSKVYDKLKKFGLLHKVDWSIKD